MSSDASHLRTFKRVLRKELEVASDSLVSPSTATLGVAFEDLRRLSDEGLIDLVKSGCSEPIAVLFTRHRQLLLGISMKILRDLNEAEDVVQDIFLEVWEKARLFDSARGTVRVWLIQYAYSRSLNRRRDLALRWGKGSGTNEAAPLREIEPSYVPDTFEKLTSEKQLDRIRGAFSRLSVKQQHALRLIYFEGLSIQEVADQMKEAVENVRHHYYRGLKRLREVLAGAQVTDRKS